MNEMMELFNQYGWTVYYFAGFTTGCIISLFVLFFGYVGEAILDFFKDLKIKKGGKNVKKL